MVDIFNQFQLIRSVPIDSREKVLMTRQKFKKTDCNFFGNVKKKLKVRQGIKVLLYPTPSICNKRSVVVTHVP